jgi:hypothetical protein
MEIFSKVHFQPRLLPRSSLKVTLFSFIAACIAVNGSELLGPDAEGADTDPPKLTSLKEKWMEEYFGFFTFKEKWFKDNLKTFIMYQENFLNPYNKLDTPEEKLNFVKKTFNSRKGQGGMPTADKFEEYLKAYRDLQGDGKRKTYFKEIVKTKLTSYGNILKGYKDIDKSVEKAAFAVAKFAGLWKNRQANGVADALQWTTRLRPADCLNHLTEEGKVALLKRKHDEGYSDGYKAGLEGPSPSQSTKVLHMNALYDRFKDMGHHLVAANDDEEYKGIRVTLNHSRCEQCDTKLSCLNLWKKWKGRDCKICGRRLCHDCTTERAYWTNKAKEKAGHKRTCKDDEGCFQPKEFDLDELLLPGKTEAEKSYKEGYQKGYRVGTTERKATHTYRFKCLLYDRFRDVVNHSYTDFLHKWRSSTKVEFVHGFGINLKLKYNRCEIVGCRSQDGLRWYNLCKKFRGMNCKTCGRLLCDDCGMKVSGQWSCENGAGCRSHIASREHRSQVLDQRWPNEDSEDITSEPPQPASGSQDHHDVPAGVGGKPVFEFSNFQKLGPDDFHDRRMLGNMTLSDSSFWQGFFTSMVIILGTFLVYHFMFQKPARSSSRKTYIKKKRSTFFKGRTSDVKSRNPVREVKGVFSKVIRRQLSKLDEN